MIQAQMPNLPEDEIARLRGYLVAQAAKLSVSELVGKLRKDVAPLRQVGVSVPAARFRERPGVDEWSAAEVYTHIIALNDSGAHAIEGILDTGAAPERLEDTLKHELRDDLATAEDYWRVFHARREQLLERVATATGDEYPAIMIHHPVFGPLTWRQWLLFMRVHDLDHTRQIQAIAST